METTFIVQQNDLNQEFLDAIKKLFKHKRQLQITITESEDFGLFQTETPQAYIERLERCMAEMQQPTHTITLSEAELDDFVLRH